MLEKRTSCLAYLTKPMCMYLFIPKQVVSQSKKGELEDQRIHIYWKLTLY